MIKNNNPPPSVFFLTANEANYKPCVAPASCVPLLADNIWSFISLQNTANFISCILSRISEVCWKLLMTDVSPHCHTPCIIWFWKQHTVFCSISMSQTVCKQLVITQFSENHYFPMKSWMGSKLGFWHGLGSTRDALQPCILQVYMKERSLSAQKIAGFLGDEFCEKVKEDETCIYTCWTFSNFAMVLLQILIYFYRIAFCKPG